MASRERQATAAADKATRAAALATLQGAPLPLPTEPRTAPALPDANTAAEIITLGASGLADAQIANHLAITLDELKGWENTHPEMAQAMSRARTAAQAWWEEQARRAVITENNRFPAAMWQTRMRAFAGYEDKPTIAINIAELVRIERRQPTGDRLPVGANTLIEHGAPQQGGSPEASGSARLNLLPSPDDDAS